MTRHRASIRLTASSTALVSLALLGACSPGPEQPADAQAERLCDEALGTAVISAGPTTTLGEIRALTVGPGYRPAKDAFPELPAGTVAAYCWATASASSGTPGILDSYAAVPGGRSVRLIGVGGFTDGSTPSGAPVIP